MYKILMFTVWVEIVHLYVLTVANSLLSGDLMLWGHPNAITGRQVRGFSECHNLCLLIPVLVYRSTVTYCTVSSSSCRCVPQSRGRAGISSRHPPLLFLPSVSDGQLLNARMMIQLVL